MCTNKQFEINKIYFSIRLFYKFIIDDGFSMKLCRENVYIKKRKYFYKISGN